MSLGIRVNQNLLDVKNHKNLVSWTDTQHGPAIMHSSLVLTYSVSALLGGGHDLKEAGESEECLDDSPHVHSAIR